MVDINKKLGYNLNHIYNDTIGNAQVEVGSKSQVNRQEINLFDKSLALTSDLKRLPVLRSFDINILLDTGILTQMSASGWMLCRIDAALYNCKISNISEEYRIGKVVAYVYYDGTSANCMIQVGNLEWDLEGGLLLYDKITMSCNIYGNANVDPAIPAGEVNADFDIEIDWVKVTKSEFEDYLLEHVYAEQQN